MCVLVDEAYGQAIREHEALEVKITSVDTMKQEASEMIGDDSGEFGKRLVDHFPIEDGMPSFSDVHNFLADRDDRFLDAHDVVDQLCQIMEFIYPLSWE